MCEKRKKRNDEVFPCLSLSSKLDNLTRSPEFTRLSRQRAPYAEKSFSRYEKATLLTRLVSISLSFSFLHFYFSTFSFVVLSLRSWYLFSHFCINSCFQGSIFFRILLSDFLSSISLFFLNSHSCSLSFSLSLYMYIFISLSYSLSVSFFLSA